MCVCVCAGGGGGGWFPVAIGNLRNVGMSFIFKCQLCTQMFTTVCDAC